MPSKTLTSPFEKDGVTPKFFKFGGGKNTVFTTNGPFPFGYNIDTGGGDDTVYGSDQDDILTGGDGDDAIFGGFGNDLIRGGNSDGSADSAKGQNPAPTNTLIGDGEQLEDGSYSSVVNFLNGPTFVGGNDEIIGGNGSSDIIAGDAQRVSTGDSDSNTFTGGHDTLRAGDGGFNVLVGDAQIIDGDGTVNGGNDIIFSGSGSDQMVGDWSNSNGFTGTAVGGTDTFVFAPNFGFDSIADFESSADNGGVAKDQINLAATGVTWAQLDTNANDVLDDGDAGVAILVGQNGPSTQINFSVVSGGDFSGLLTITGEDALVVDDFDFTTVLV